MPRIANNITAFNAFRQLDRADRAFAKSVEKLSSGLRINTAADDPAGLVISESLRSQISGIDQALRNTEDAVSMIQIAEGALTEMHSLLNSMRALALHASNTGATNASAIAADQEQIDSAVTSLQTIATTTSFVGKNLLDGTAGNRGTVISTGTVSKVSIGSSAPGGNSFISLNITTAATQATVTGFDQGSAGTTLSGATITINGVEITLSSGYSVASAANKLQTAVTSAGLDLKIASATGVITVNHNQYGDGFRLDILDTNGILLASGFSSTAGTDIAGTINSSGATGDGLTLRANDGTAYAGTSVTLAVGGNSTGVKSNVAVVTNGSVAFQVGANGTNQTKVSLADMSINKLGTDVGGSTGLNSIKSGGAFSLSTDPFTALKVIDEAIGDISSERSKLGSVQKNVLESNITSLSIARENLQASESRIRDVDLALETAEFTKNQILISAATAMLAQANLSPQSVLQLLQ